MAAAEPLTVLVPSSDGVQIAVHDLGGDGPTLLISHATGFHGRAYLPLAEALKTSFHCVAFDYRGHGDTPQPAGRTPDWDRYGDDAVAMSASLAASLDTPVAAFGHSMGGACLLMAAHRRPELFTRLVVFEPIVFPPSAMSERPNPLARGARRRRASFPTYAAAIANFSGKPPLNAFTPAALDAYVRFGFAPGEDGQVHLKCHPAVESDTFAGGPLHRTWELLPEITVPTVVLSGRVDEDGPAGIAAGIASRLPDATYRQLTTVDHFGPMTHPELIAEEIRLALR